MNKFNILVLISNYESNQFDYCKNQINTIKQIKKFNFDIKVFSSEENTLIDCENFFIKNYDGHNFAMSIYDFLKNSFLDNYTHVLMTENDLLFNEKNFDCYFKHEKILSNTPYSVGFWRFEIKNNSKYLIDLGYDEKKLDLETKFGIDEILLENKYFRTKSCHQGCWFLKIEDVKKLINKIQIGPTLEDKVSNYIFSTEWPGSTDGVKKIIPFEDFENLLIHHQSNKYVKKYNDLPSVDFLIAQKNKIYLNKN